MKELHELVAKSQAEAIRSISARTTEVYTLNLKLKQQQDAMKDFVQLMNSPDANPELIFGQMQKLGIELTEDGVKMREMEETHQRIQALTKVDQIVDLRKLTSAVNELGKETAKVQSQADSLLDSVPPPKYITEELIKQQMMEEAEKKLIDPKIAAEFVKSVGKKHKL